MDRQIFVSEEDYCKYIVNETPSLRQGRVWCPLCDKHLTLIGKFLVMHGFPRCCGNQPMELVPTIDELSKPFKMYAHMRPLSERKTIV